jgi:hypothetical protein
LYVEDLKPGTNKDIGPKDIFEMGSRSIQGMCIDAMICSAVSLYLG